MERVVKDMGILNVTELKINLSNKELTFQVGKEDEYDFIRNKTVCEVDEVIDVRSNVVYTNSDNKGMVKSGIEFVEVNLDALIVLRKYIEEFHKQYPE